MSSIIEQYINNHSFGISEYARQLDKQINESGIYKGVIKNFNNPINTDSIAIFHFSNASRMVLLPLIRRKTGKNIVIIHDILPRTFFLKPLNRVFFDIIGKYAETIIVHTTIAKELLLSLHSSFNPGNVVVIPHGSNIHKVSDEEKEQLRLKYGFNTHDKLLFLLGVISRQRGQLAFLETFAQTKYKNLKLIVAGKCKNKKAIDFMKENNSLSYYGPVTNSRLKELFKICDAIVVYRRYSVGESSSAIAYGIGYGKPVLVSAFPSFMEMLGNAGLFFNNDRRAIQELLLRISSSEINLEDFKPEIIRLQDNYKWETYFHKIRALIEK